MKNPEVIAAHVARELRVLKATSYHVPHAATHASRNESIATKFYHENANNARRAALALLNAIVGGTPVALASDYVDSSIA